MKHLPGLAEKKIKDYSSCSGCSLCLLVCPVWRQTYDITRTAHGRAKALQYNASVEELDTSILGCTLCRSCDVACTEGINQKETLLGLRRALVSNKEIDNPFKKIEIWMEKEASRPVIPAPKNDVLLLPSRELRQEEAILSKVEKLLRIDGKGAIAEDNGWDIALAIEAGMTIPPARLEKFLSYLKNAHQLIVYNSLLKQALEKWLPKCKVRNLAKELMSEKELIEKLKPSDLYIIESREYNSNFAFNVKQYDKIKKAQNCSFNLDLQRIAIPTAATSLQWALKLDGFDYEDQARWILEGKNFDRIVVENLEDGEVFKKVTDVTVVFLAELVDPV